MSYYEEFKTVDLILSSDAKTKGVDAFSLSLIKCERQIRRLFTHLVFQSPHFAKSDIAELRSVLADSRCVYFEGFIRGIDAIYRLSVKDLVGDIYDASITRIEEATRHRNKIFHGQLTPENLKRVDLIECINNIRFWCETLSVAAEREFGYDGFGRNSFCKSKKTELFKSFKVNIDSVQSYRDFVGTNMNRH